MMCLFRRATGSIRVILCGVPIKWLNVRRNEELLFFIILSLEFWRYRAGNLVHRLRGDPMEEAEACVILRRFHVKV